MVIAGTFKQRLGSLAGACQTIIRNFQICGLVSSPPLRLVLFGASFLTVLGVTFLMCKMRRTISNLVKIKWQSRGRAQRTTQ